MMNAVYQRENQPVDVPAELLVESKSVERGGLDDDADALSTYHTQSECSEICLLQDTETSPATPTDKSARGTGTVTIKGGKKKVRMMIPDPEAPPKSPSAESASSLAELQSYTQARVSTLAAPPDMPRPRSLFRQATSVSPRAKDKKGKAIYVATRANKNIIHKSASSRFSYALVLLNIVLWVPLWLKLATIQRRDARERFESVYNESVRLRLEVETFDDPESRECHLCDERSKDNTLDDVAFNQQLSLSQNSERVRRRTQGTNFDDDEYYSGVTYGVTAHIEGYHSAFEVGTTSYVIIYGSHDFVHWELYNQVGLLTGLKKGDQTVEVCLPKGYEADDGPQLAENDDHGVSKITYFKEVTKNTDQIKAGEDDNDIVTYESILDNLEAQTEWETFAPTAESEHKTDPPTPLILGDEYKSRCCLGNAGFTYLVACATPFEKLAFDEMYTLVRGAPFEDRCVALHGRCGSACGVTSQVPKENTCDENGNIPLKRLLSPEILGKGKRKFKNRWKDRRHDVQALRSIVYHTLFVVFVTMMATGTWISFLPGVGKSKNSPKPSMTEIEEYVATNDEDAKPLCIVCFAISASEPRMMVLRNMVGKLMSMVNQRKFSLMPRNPPQSIYTSEVTSLSTMFGDDESPNYRNRQSYVQKVQQGVDYMDIAEMVDIFEDEGHRVGAYALWDAFIDVVHDSDLRFAELLAQKMTNMSADEDKLSSKKEGDGTLLDKELREFMKKPHVGVTEDDVEKLELAFATFDLLTKLGHQAFWRSDRNVSVVGFRELASDPAAVATLKKWAEKYKKGKKRGLDPFDSDIVPSEDPSISPDIWQSWWELYAELGRIQWMKRFDCTKFRLARLHYYRDVEDNATFRDLMMCYSARANPEDLSVQIAPTRNIRGIKPGVFVRLKEVNNDEIGDRYAFLGLKQLQRSEARRCHARVIRIFWGKRKHDQRKVRYVKLRECTPELLKAIPRTWLACHGRMPEFDEGDDDDFDDDDIPEAKGDKKSQNRRAGVDLESANRALKGYRPPRGAGAFENEEAIVPLEVLQPLRESRGKAGGMNHAMEILNHYLRHHSSTFTLIKEKRSGAVPPGSANKKIVDAHLLFAIFDCRHMGQKGFWDAVIPYFYTYKHVNNPWGRELEIDTSVAFVQLPQTFTSLSLETDIFDMRNEYAFRLANNLRNGVGAITSCGTNAVWNYDIRYQENPLEHRFNEDTMIEDTASSHDVIIEGRKGVYHFERLVLGARKGTTDYLAAVFRWSRGAVQLAWTTFYFPRSGYLWPWLSILVHVCPIVGCVAWLQMQKLDECHRTWLASRSGWVPCRWGPVVGIAADPVFVLYVTWMITLTAISFHWSRLPALIVMFENVTYFFTSISAFFWIALPMYMCLARNGLPPILDTQVVTVGGLWFQLANAMLISHIRDWSPLENGKPPSNQSLLRAQQMFFVNAPLHILAMFFGNKDGLSIIFFGKDASRWASFDNKMAIIAVKSWALTMIACLATSISFGIYNIVEIDETAQQRGARLIGIFMCCIITYLIETPVRAMFFFERVVRQKEKASFTDKATKAIFGDKQVISPDLFYLLLWTTLIFISFQEQKLGKSTSVLNTARRCRVNPSLEGCPRDDEKYIIRRSKSIFDD